MQRSKSRHAAAFGGNIYRISCTAVTLQMKQSDRCMCLASAVATIYSQLSHSFGSTKYGAAINARPANNAESQRQSEYKAFRIMNDWMPNLAARDKPRYLAIADAIADDIRSGRLAASDRLPPQRKLARCLDIDFTTVARGYVEAQKRGLIESHVGRGTFVRPSARRRHSPMARHPEVVDLSMNLPPEPDDPELLDRMQDGLEAVRRDLVSVLHAQGFAGVKADKDAASSWLSRRALVPPQDRLFIAPGAHPALLGIFGLLTKSGDVILSEDLTYPATR